MFKFEIIGKQPLQGEIAVYGAKNAAMKMIAASIIIGGKVILENVPDILDIAKETEILRRLGGKITRQGHRLTLDMRNIQRRAPDSDLVRSMRASVVLVGPLLARFGKVRIPHPGGCFIGARPIDMHCNAFRDLDVDVAESKDSYQFQLKGPVSDRVHFPKITVTGTENIILFAASIDKSITIENAAIEPEVIDLIEFLKKAGAKISIQGRTIKISGSKSLKPIEYRVIPDRIEAGTYAILGATARANIKITGLNPHHIRPLLDSFKKMNINYTEAEDYLEIRPSPEIRSTTIETSEYPGFPTDLQSPMGVLMTQAKGTSTIRENIFEHRLRYLEELQKMGAKIKLINNFEAEISGPTELQGAEIQSLDLRAGATMLIAALIAYGKSEIAGAETIDRGYEKIEERLQKIGAKIQRLKCS